MFKSKNSIIHLCPKRIERDLTLLFSRGQWSVFSQTPESRKVNLCFPAFWASEMNVLTLGVPAVMYLDLTSSSWWARAGWLVQTVEALFCHHCFLVTGTNIKVSRQLISTPYPLLFLEQYLDMWTWGKIKKQKQKQLGTARKSPLEPFSTVPGLRRSFTRSAPAWTRPTLVSATWPGLRARCKKNTI